MTPSQIEILIHYHINNKDPHPRVDAPAVQEAVALFVREGVLKPVVRGVHPLPHPATLGPHQTTDRGHALVKMLCDTPFPVAQWIDPRTGKAVEDIYATAEAAPAVVPATCPGCGVNVGQKHTNACSPALIGWPFTPLDSRPVCNLCDVVVGGRHLTTCASNLGGKVVKAGKIHRPECSPNRCVCGADTAVTA